MKDEELKRGKGEEIDTESKGNIEEVERILVEMYYDNHLNISYI